MSAAGRLPLVDEASDDPVLARVFGRFLDAGHEVPTLYRTLGNAPAMLGAWVAMAWPLRNDATTSRQLRELIIMRVAQITRARYEWVAHRPAALKFGVSEEQLADLHRWADSELFADDEREVLALTEVLIRHEDIPDELWSSLEARYAPGELVELILTVSYYSCVSCTLRALQLPVDDADPALADF